MGCSPDAGAPAILVHARDPVGIAESMARRAQGWPEIRVNGVSLYYEEHGAGEPILCIHGTGSSAALWVDAAAELAAHGRTIVYDRRGFSRSERPEPYVTNVHQHADDAAALIDALAAAPAIVIGRSYGGEIAVDLALRYPDRVRALALLEGGGMLAERGVHAVGRRARRAGRRRGRGRREHRRRDDAPQHPGRCRLGRTARAGEAALHRQRTGDRRRVPRRPSRRQRGAARLHRSADVARRRRRTRRRRSRT